MTLTPSDIEQKTFSTALRGYNLDEVDDFLDEVVRSMRKLHEELDTARSELEARGTEVDESPEPALAATPAPAPVVEAPTPPPAAPIDESAVGKALIAAQETAERIVTDARSEADEILVRARNEAETFEESRLKRKDEAEQEITRIDGLVNRVKAELADLSVAVGAELNGMSGAIDAAITDLDNSPGEPDDGPESDDGFPSDEADGENIVVAGTEQVDEDTEDMPEVSGGRRRHRSEVGEDDGDGTEDDSEDGTEDDSEDGTEDDSEDGTEDDYFNFPDGDDEDEDEDDNV